MPIPGKTGSREAAKSLNLRGGAPAPARPRLLSSGFPSLQRMRGNRADRLRVVNGDPGTARDDPKLAPEGPRDVREDLNLKPDRDGAGMVRDDPKLDRDGPGDPTPRSPRVWPDRYLPPRAYPVVCSSTCTPGAGRPSRIPWTERSSSISGQWIPNPAPAICH
jgi:hypothetical protein